MFKPLLKSIPSLSGNMKIVCDLEGYKIDSSNRYIYNCNVNNAYLTSISSNIYDKNIPVNLKNNSFEYDVQQFYLYYADIFYKNNFNYSKINIPIIDFTSTINNSNTDFKFGCKRVSYMKSGNTLAFYSPIYVEGEEDIKGKYFVITCIFNKVYQLKKQIKIKISNINEGNNLADYLVRYASKLDDRVINCSSSYKNIYYGISLKKGGFVRIEDNISSNLYNKYYTINDFDATINKGFERNYLMMKQVIPLSFYFDPNNLLNDFEKNIYNNAEVIIQGRWYDENDNEIPFYDFSDDYSKFEEDIYNLYYEDEFRYVNTEKNIMDLKYPACNEASSNNYRFINTVYKTYNRWKLKYSDDNYPYIINNNYAFSFNQGSLYTYKEFPILYSSMRAFAKLVSNTEYNLLFDYNDVYGKDNYTILNNKSQYFDLYNKNYIANFFNLFDDGIFNKDEVWSNVNKDGKVYHKGILYDLNTIYNDNLRMDYKIDKFAVFVNPNFDYTLAKDFNDTYKECKTVFSYNFSNITDYFNYYQLTSKYSYLYNYKVARKDDNGEYIDLGGYLLNQNNIYDHGNNIYIDVNDIYIVNFILNNKKIDLSNTLVVNDKEITLNLIDGFKIIEVHNVKNIFDKYFKELKSYYKQPDQREVDNMLFRSRKFVEIESIYWAVDKLYFSIYPNKTKYSLIKNYELLENIEDKNIVLYYKSQFVRLDDDLDNYLGYYYDVLGYDYDLRYGSQLIITGSNNINSPLKYKTYFFSNGLYDKKGKILYTSQVFRELNELNRNYGQWFDASDINFIYVDPYNLEKLHKIYGLEFNPEFRRDFYCNFLNMDHIRLYHEKLYKNADLSGEFSIDNIFIKIRNFNNIIIKLNDNANTDFSTITVQDDYIPITNFGLYNINDITYFIDYIEEDKCFSFNDNYNKYIEAYNKVINGEDVKVSLSEYYKYLGIIYMLSIYNIKHFEICFKKEMIALTEDLYHLIINRENDEIFKDLYLYHIEDPKDYKCQMYYNDTKAVELNENEENIADTIWDKTSIVEHTIDVNCHINISGNLALTGLKDFYYNNNITSSLEPYFNEIYDENMTETKIYSDYFINNIIKTTNGSDIRFRYNEPSINILAYMPNSDISSDYKYSLVNNINDSFMTASQFVQQEICEPDNIDEYSNLITYNYNGTYYGFYIINSYFDNTNNTINIQNEDLAYINCVDYINGIHVSNIKESYLGSIYKNMLPYMNISNPAKFLLSNANTIIKPQIYKLKNNIKQYPNSKINSSYSYTLYLTKEDSYIELSRYFDDIVPYTPKVQYINSYYLYYKDTNKFIEHDLDIKNQAYIMYQDHVNMNKFSYVSYFDIDANIKKYEPTEYKYYNFNKYFNLEKEINIEIDRVFTEEELVEYENNEDKIFKLFMNYINNTHFDALPNKDKINNYLFLYKKYQVKFIHDFKYINSSNSKVYSLTIKFSLL